MIDVVDRYYDSSWNWVQLGQRGKGEAHFTGSPSLYSWGGRCHRPEVMFGVLVVVLCPNRVTD
jgi:hypothetical protein